MPLSLAVYSDAEKASPEVESRFFAKLRLPNGTWKTTSRHRLDDLNELLLLLLLPTERDLRLLDVAVSSGVSTLEWSEQLEANGVAHSLTAVDLAVEATLTSSGNWLALLCLDRGREPILLELGPVSLPVRSERATVRAVRPALARLLRGVDSLARRNRADGGTRKLARRPVSLVLREVRERPQIEVVEEDLIAGGGEGGFDVVRAANLVQRSYFDDETLRRIVANLRARLNGGGLLVLCQTLDERNHGTVFRLDGGHFRAIAAVGDGFPARDLVLSL